MSEREYLDMTHALVFIPGVHHAKRALTVAVCGDHSIRFVGSDLSVAQLLVDAYKRLYLERWTDEPPPRKAIWVRPCPCGHYGFDTHPCTCSVSTVDRYRKSVFHQRVHYDITVDVPDSRWEDIMALLPKMPETQYRLLKAAIQQLGLSFLQASAIMTVAKTISQMANAEEIGLAHNAEAIQYRART